MYCAPVTDRNVQQVAVVSRTPNNLDLFIGAVPGVDWRALRPSTPWPWTRGY